MLTAQKDLYNGLIIDTSTISSSFSDFKTALITFLEQAKLEKKSLIWMDLTSKQSQHIALALDLGFIFHNCEYERTTLIFKVDNDAYIPVSPTHTLGVGGIVINNNNEILLVRDKIHTSSSIYKIPGGMLEHASRLSDGVQREVWEETGIKTKLIKMVSILNSHPYRFNKSNMYIVFHLEPLTTEINIIDTHEIEKALWMPLEEFFANKEMSKFQKDLVNATLEHEGLGFMENEIYFKNKKHVEVYA